jgi:hypothetical protein
MANHRIKEFPVIEVTMCPVNDLTGLLNRSQCQLSGKQALSFPTFGFWIPLSLSVFFPPSLQF